MSRRMIIALAWHVATTHHRSELVAEENLIRQAERMAARGYGLLQPLNIKVKTSSVVRGRKQTVENPYFTGYIFLQFDADATEWGFINSTRGVKQLMTSDGKPCRILDRIMAPILEQCEGDYVRSSEIIDRVIHKFIPLGSTIRAKLGPFAGFEGPVKLSTHDKVQVMFGMFGRPVLVDFKPADVELV